MKAARRAPARLTPQRVTHRVGSEANPNNFLILHAMGPNVAGVLGSAVAAGILLALLG
jgi:Na+-transporting methylmalonyl-CoA/oxaloacetate decarboxylase beta subunit